MEVRKKLSGTENGLEIQTTAQEIKQTLEKATGALPFSAEVQQTWSHKFDKAENALHFQAELQSLCYQLFSDGGMTAMEPYAAPLQVEILYSLGGGASSFALDSTVVEISKNSFLQTGDFRNSSRVSGSVFTDLCRRCRDSNSSFCGSYQSVLQLLLWRQLRYGDHSEARRA